MKTLTENECLEWLAARNISSKPYESAGMRSDQFKLPAEASRVSALFRNVIAHSEISFGEALLQATDWPLYMPDEMEIVSRVRQTCGEDRPLIETPGHVFTFTEQDVLIGLMALMTSYA